MSRLLKLNLPVRADGDGLEIGADVPLLLYGRSSHCLGNRGKVEKIELPELWYVLIYPNFEVFNAIGPIKISCWQKSNFHLSFNGLKAPRDVSEILSNDLEKVVSRRHPEIDLMKECSALQEPKVPWWQEAAPPFLESFRVRRKQRSLSGRSRGCPGKRMARPESPKPPVSEDILNSKRNE